MKTHQTMFSTAVAVALSSFLVLSAPLAAQAASWGNYYAGDVSADTWKTHSAVQGRFTGSRASVLPNNATAVISVPAAGTTSIQGEALVTYAATNTISKCKWVWIGGSIGKANLTCANRTQY